MVWLIEGKNRGRRNEKEGEERRRKEKEGEGRRKKWEEGEGMVG